ncbi:tripartite tricarboxylate transporter substrate binding protein [Vibrio porteresiae]|uniref:Tripartite tricarboxylate transporter substrate-binding protein n=1 Tax=Vibrio porteresiae DSM 19223 TaxID=1123496 RepID=A0ABZ0Q7T3_9VIBR|nr:tripartite tricarboxylate transporter substrate-binding protein [Vibrio porteresiae]WPC72488.1 tripartite tricarboxylate transporter substrate-binding protein [Vibrio porteresiae DSM 19223]
MLKRLTLLLATTLLAVTFSISAQPVASVHFLIPGGAGGGWDLTARGTGDVLLKAGLAEKVSYQNLSGGGGGKAIAHLVETADRQEDTLMVNSTPIVLRSLAGVFPQSFRDLTPVAATISDFGALVVAANSPYHSWPEVVTAFKKNPRAIKVAGGSARGSMDHLVAAAAFKGHGQDPREVRYIAYDAGGKALASLLSGETQLLSTGFSEVVQLAASGQVRILAITSPTRVAVAPDIPTLNEFGNRFVFANWRGFFAAPGVDSAKVDEWVAMLKAMYATKEWQQVRDRNGWIDSFKAKGEFEQFLYAQEDEMRALMKELGFLQ